MLEELVDHVIDIDPDRDWVTAAVVDARITGKALRGCLLGKPKRWQVALHGRDFDEFCHRRLVPWNSAARTCITPMPGSEQWAMPGGEYDQSHDGSRAGHHPDGRRRMLGVGVYA